MKSKNRLVTCDSRSKIISDKKQSPATTISDKQLPVERRPILVAISGKATSGGGNHFVVAFFRKATSQVHKIICLNYRFAYESNSFVVHRLLLHNNKVYLIYITE